MEVHNRSEYKDYKTALQWEKAGYKVKRRQQPHVMWTNQFCQISAKYYAPEQVRPMTDAERERYRLKQAERRRTARIRLMAKKKATQRMLERKCAQQRREQIRFQKLADKRVQIADHIASIRAEDITPIYDMVVLDVETTGFEYEDELLQVSMIDGDGNVLYNGYLKPIIARSWKSAEYVNHISFAMVKDAPTPDAELPKIARIIYGAKSIMGYNVEFDLVFLAKYGIFPRQETDIIDAMLLFADVYGEWSEEYNCYKWQNLGIFTSYYGYDWKDTTAHDSLADCHATLYCYKKMLQGTEDADLSPYTGARAAVLGSEI